MSKPDISIIIRTLNEERYLPELLSSIQEQRSPFSHEVVLIDSGSTDNTLNIAERFGCRILHISREDFSFGRSLNRACEAAHGAYFVLISGHCIPCDRDWLQNLVQPLAQNIIQYSYGRQVGSYPTNWSEHQIFAKYFPEKSSIPQQGFYCNNANSAILADTWRHYRFNEELTGLEDMDLAKRLVSDQRFVGYVANACVHHIHHEDWQQVQRRYEREALALQQICPEVIIRRRDIVRYFSRGIINDLLAVPPKELTFKTISQIIRYRYNQYLGSYCGNHMHKLLSAKMRDSYFYPSHSNPSTIQTRGFPSNES